MKVFLIYDHASDPALHHKLAITLPTKWLEQSCDKVKETFVNAYNKKFPDNPLDDEDFVLSVKDNSPFTNRDYKLLTISDTPAKAFEDKGEVRLVPAPPANAGQPGVLPNGKSRCKNYGCQCEYTEAENSESACRHHAARPIFHDTRKWWSCCDGVKVYSFDELLSIPGCEVGRHSSVPPLEEQQREAEMKAATNKVLEMHMAASKPDAQGKAPPPKQDFTPSAPPKPRPKPNLPPGYARCKHHGCQKDYLIESNTGNTCVYHKQAPVFHEGAKKWTCCGVSRWDFDDFLAVPGCAVGPHEPVE
ncbi:hypothetical protein AB1Y20_005376 [Prymnesium parvum]|uniref:CHORD domain-containing protein n=1 Tax=Prymnesium parvum TaxID=97485 RepID=A0AB34J6B5_PRYPA